MNIRISALVLEALNLCVLLLTVGVLAPNAIPTTARKQSCYLRAHRNLLIFIAFIQQHSTQQAMSPAQLHSLYFQLGAPAAEKVRVPLCFNFRGIRIANNVGSRNIAPLYT